MAVRAADTAGSRQEPVITVISPSSDIEAGRGRKRSRSTVRGDIRSLRTEESSTLRGRSRRRASSPCDVLSRSSSPVGEYLRCAQLRQVRRAHCPSRAVSPSGHTLLRRRQRSRSRTRTHSRGMRVDRDLYRLADVASQLRNELRLLPNGDWVTDDHK